MVSLDELADIRFKSLHIAALKFAEKSVQQNPFCQLLTAAATERNHVDVSTVSVAIRQLWKGEFLSWLVHEH